LSLISGPPEPSTSTSTPLCVQSSAVFPMAPELMAQANSKNKVTGFPVGRAVIEGTFLCFRYCRSGTVPLRAANGARAEVNFQSRFGAAVFVPKVPTQFARSAAATSPCLSYDTKVLIPKVARHSTNRVDRAHGASYGRYLRKGYSRGQRSRCQAL
jgi:hypothetical protein